MSRVLWCTESVTGLPREAEFRIYHIFNKLYLVVWHYCWTVQTHKSRVLVRNLVVKQTNQYLKAVKSFRPTSLVINVPEERTTRGPLKTGTRDNHEDTDPWAGHTVNSIVDELPWGIELGPCLTIDWEDVTALNSCTAIHVGSYGTIGNCGPCETSNVSKFTDRRFCRGTGSEGGGSIWRNVQKENGTSTRLPYESTNLCISQRSNW